MVGRALTLILARPVWFDPAQLPVPRGIACIM